MLLHYLIVRSAKMPREEKEGNLRILLYILNVCVIIINVCGTYEKKRKKDTKK